MDAEPPLLSREDVRRLERLSLASLDAIAAGVFGAREGTGDGTGIEFADYRRYTPGDDLQRIDWNVYGRLRELFVRTAPTEARIWLSVMLDASLSMGRGGLSRLHFGRRLAALLGTVALLRNDSVQVHLLSDGEAVSGAWLDTAGMLKLLALELERLPAGRTTQLDRSIRHARGAGAPPELAVLISDCLVAPADLDAAISELAQAGRATALAQIVDPAEDVMGPLGDFLLRDVESGRQLPVSVTGQVRRRYADRYEQFCRQTEQRCRADGVSYLAASTAIDPLELLLAGAGSGVIARD